MDPDQLLNLNALIAAGKTPPPSDGDDDVRNQLADALLAHGSAPASDPQSAIHLADALDAWTPQGAGGDPGGQDGSGGAPAVTLQGPTPIQIAPPDDLQGPANLAPVSTQGVDALSGVTVPDDGQHEPDQQDETAMAAGQAPMGDGGQGGASDADAGSLGQLVPISTQRADPWVTAFRNEYLPDAIKLAQIIGHGVTPDEIIAISGAESAWGQSSKAVKHGNFFGIHAAGVSPSHYFPRQIDTFPTGGGPMAAYDLKTGFYDSGLRLASRMSAAAGNADLSDPATFFALAHSLKWGVGTDGYLEHMQNVYKTVRRSAAATEKHS